MQEMLKDQRKEEKDFHKEEEEEEQYYISDNNNEKKISFNLMVVNDPHELQDQHLTPHDQHERQGFLKKQTSFSRRFLESKQHSNYNKLKLSAIKDLEREVISNILSIKLKQFQNILFRFFSIHVIFFINNNIFFNRAGKVVKICINIY